MEAKTNNRYQKKTFDRTKRSFNQGTGKTVQTITALRFLYRQAIVRKSLIICPLSVIGSAQLSIKTGKSEGWDGHLFHWAPELSVTVVHGNEEQRRLDWNYPAHVYIATGRPNQPFKRLLESLCTGDQTIAISLW